MLVYRTCLATASQESATASMQNIQALQDLISATEKSGSSCEVIPELHDQIRDFMAQAQEYQAALDLANVPGYVEPCQEVDDSTSTQLDTSSPDGAVSDAHAKAFSALRASGPNDRLMNAKDLGGDVYNRHAACHPCNSTCLHTNTRGCVDIRCMCK